MVAESFSGPTGLYAPDMIPNPVAIEGELNTDSLQPHQDTTLVLACSKPHRLPPSFALPSLVLTASCGKGSLPQLLFATATANLVPLPDSLSQQLPSPTP